MERGHAFAWAVLAVLLFAQLSEITPVSFGAQALTPFSGTLKRSYAPVGFGLDLGRIDWGFSQTQISWADTSGHNMSFNVPKVSGTGLGLTTSQNSTTIDYHMSGTVVGRSVVLDVFLKQQKWNYKITIRGTISGAALTMPLTLPVPVSALRQTNLDGSNAPTVCIDHLCLDWSDASSVCSFATSILTCTIGNSFSIDPLALDNTVQKTCAGPITTCTSAGTVEGLNDIIIFACANTQSSDSLSASSTPSLTWTKRKTASVTGGTLDEFYAVSSGSQSYTFTCSESTGTNSIVIRIFGISGADTSTIFDSDGSLPCANTGTTGTTESCTISTKQTNDFIFLVETNLNQATVTACAGFTLIGAGNAFPTAVYKIVSATQTNLSVCVTTVANQTWVVIADAVFQTQTTITATTTTTSTATSNLGDPVPYTWLLAVPLVIVAFYLILRKV